MSLKRNEKAAVIEDVATQVAKSQTLALAEYRGLTIENLNKLRVDARSKGVYLHVVKNSLARRAVVGTPFEVAAESMVGRLIYSFSEDRASGPRSSPTCSTCWSGRSGCWARRWGASASPIDRSAIGAPLRRRMRPRSGIGA